MRRGPWIAVAIAAACGQSAAPMSRSQAPRPTAERRIARIEQGLLTAPPVRGEDVRFSLADRMEKYKIPAVSIAVFADYRLQWARAYGIADVETGSRATEETIFLAGSISKSVNGLAVLMAAADGTLSLDAPINDMLQSWKLPENALTRATPVTLRRLLSHSAGTTVHGFPGYAAGAPVPTIEQILDGAPPSNTPPVRVDVAPGSVFRYSGGGTTISQLALTERSKRAYPDVLAERVLVPFGMAHSTFEQTLPRERLAQAAAGHGSDGKVIAGKRHSYPEMAAAGLWTTPSDLARFFAEIALARAGRSKRISRSIASAMTARVIDTGQGSASGLGVFLHERYGAPFFGHGGADAGFQALAVASLEGYGLVVMANSENGFRLFPEIERAVFAEYGWKGADPPVERVVLSAEHRGRVAGTFVADGQPFTITDRGGALELRAPFGEAVELVPLAADRFMSRADGIMYKLDASGSAFEMRDARGGTTRTATRLPAGARLPILDLAAGRFDDAVAVWKQLAKSDPKNPAVDEAAFNGLGYSKMAEDIATAILILRMVEAANPDSSNASDSLGEAYMVAGDKARAIAAYEAALAKLDADPRIPADRKPAIRTYQRGQLAKLRGAP